MIASDSLRFVALVDHLRHQKGEIAELARREDGDHRQAIVQLRRKIAQQLIEVGAAGERLFADSPDLVIFREKFSRLRSSTAAHQADWPAVMLGEQREAFLASVEPMRRAGTDFFQWVTAATSPRT
jgi:hypothetical protein